MSLTPTRLPQLLKLARARDCVRCGGGADTVVAAHYQGQRSHDYGKGRGLKPHDALAAHLCFSCHGQADRSGLAKDPTEHSRQFLLLVIATQLQLFAEERIVADAELRCLLLELLGNASTLMEAGEEELHHTALRLGEAWTREQIRVAPGGAMVGDYVGRPGWGA